MDKKWLVYAALLLAGAIVAGPIRRIPVIGPKLPTVG